jgi:hypothetical protein
MSKTTVTKLVPGNVYVAGYVRRGIDNRTPNRFVGFKVGEQVFSNLSLLKQAYGVKNLRDLEAEADRLELGSVTAEFYDCDDQFFWSAYLWNGAFRVGSSADRLAFSN